MSRSEEAPDGAHEPQIVIEIRDSGPGIPEPLLAQIFDAFVTTKPDGNGLGLAICRTILNDHQGAISAANLPGGGACFSIALPAQRDRQEQAPAEGTPPLARAPMPYKRKRRTPRGQPA
jgi:signal transduction histidine kinase